MVLKQLHIQDDKLTASMLQHLELINTFSFMPCTRREGEKGGEGGEEEVESSQETGKKIT